MCRIMRIFPEMRKHIDHSMDTANVNSLCTLRFQKVKYLSVFLSRSRNRTRRKSHSREQTNGQKWETYLSQANYVEMSCWEWRRHRLLWHPKRIFPCLLAFLSLQLAPQWTVGTQLKDPWGFKMRQISIIADLFSSVALKDLCIQVNASNSAHLYFISIWDILEKSTVTTKCIRPQEWMGSSRPSHSPTGRRGTSAESPQQLRTVSPQLGTHNSPAMESEHWQKIR